MDGNRSPEEIIEELRTALALLEKLVSSLETTSGESVVVKTSRIEALGPGLFSVESRILRMSPCQARVLQLLCINFGAVVSRKVLLVKGLGYAENELIDPRTGRICGHLAKALSDVVYMVRRRLEPTRFSIGCVKGRGYYLQEGGDRQ